MLYPFVYTVPNPNNGQSESEMLPAFIPNVAADLCAFDVHVTEIVLTNESNAAVTVTIKDKTTGRMLVPPATLGAYGATAFEFRGAFMPGGINWVCSAANAVTARMRVTPA